MAVELKADRSKMFVDKAALERILDEQYLLMGLKYDPTMTAEQVRRMMLAEGIDPSGNEFSRGITEMREE